MPGNAFAMLAIVFSKAILMEPDNLQYRTLLGEANLHLGASDEAEAHFRSVIRVAPCNIEAQIGLGETLIAAADKGQVDLYADAISHLKVACKLVKSMDAPDKNWEGSTRLNRPQQASLLYALGYAEVKLYESQVGDGLFPRVGSWRLLSDAQEHFDASWHADESHFRAKRAHEKTREARRLLHYRSVSEGVAQVVVVVLVLVLLALAQLAFYFGWPARLHPTEWTIATFGLLAFLVTGLSLPRLLKLKVAGVELERSNIEQAGRLTTLGLQYGQVMQILRPAAPAIPAPLKPSMTSRPTQHSPLTPDLKTEAAKGKDELGEQGRA